MGHITTGDEAHAETCGAGQMIGIDRGSNAGVVLGQRFLVFRDKRGDAERRAEYSPTYVQNAHRHLPLVEVGEVLVGGGAAG